jgi:hypothetical protein
MKFGEHVERVRTSKKDEVRREDADGYRFCFCRVLSCSCSRVGLLLWMRGYAKLPCDSFYHRIEEVVL